MNKLTTAKRAAIVSCLVEGNSVRSTERITGADKKTILRLLVQLGEACRDYQDRTLVDLPCKKIQADEIWAFAYCKDKNVPEKLADKKKAGLVGSIWTWTAICADTKLVFVVPRRHARCRVRVRIHVRPRWTSPWSRAAHHRWPRGVPERGTRLVRS